MHPDIEAKGAERLAGASVARKRMLADAMQDNATLKDLLEKVVTPAAHREAGAYLRLTYEKSERRACRVIGADRTSVRNQATQPKDCEPRERIRIPASAVGSGSAP